MTAVVTGMLPDTAQAHMRILQVAKLEGVGSPGCRLCRRLAAPQEGEGGVPVILRLVSLAQVPGAGPAGQLQLDAGTLHAVLGGN